MAALAKPSVRVSRVTINGLVLLKIMKHSRTTPVDADAQGFLVGMVREESSGHHVDISNCFPFVSEEDELDDGQSMLLLLRSLRDANIDHIQIGWYQTANFSSFMTETSITTQLDYQKLHPESVLLVYDPIRTSHGALSLKCFRLSQRFLNIFESNDVTFDRLREERLAFGDILEEIPLHIQMSHLSRALVEDLRVNLKQNETFDHLELSTHVFLEKNVRLIMDRIDELLRESQNFQAYQRKYTHQQNQRNYLLAKRREENQSRVAQGLPPLPEDDVGVKPLAPFPCLGSLLVASQITRYCSQVSQFASQSFGRLYLAQGLQGKD